MSPTWIAIFVTLPLILPLVMGIRNYRHHQAISREARQRRWRMVTSGWRTLFRPSFRLAGLTPGGVVWEMQRRWENGRMFLLWRSPTRSLPFGTLVVHQAESKLPAEMTADLLRPLVVDHPGWPATYRAAATHAHLGHFLADSTVVDLLGQFGPSPPNSPLEQIVWERESLVIICPFAESWPLFEAVVVLGGRLIDLVGQAEKTRQG